MGLFDLFKSKKQVPAATIATHAIKPQNADNEYANAVFLSIHKGPPHPHNAKAHLAWLSYKLGINDPTAKHLEMFTRGFFREARPDEILGTYKVDALKAILEVNGLKAEGKKAILIDSILKAIPVECLGLPKLYRLSSQGWDFIEQHQDLILLFNNPYNIKYEEYIAVKRNSPPYLKYNDIIWRIFNKWELETPINDCFNRKHIRLYQAMFLHDESRFSDSLSMFIQYLYFDLNRPEFYWMIKNGKVSTNPEDTISMDPRAQKAIFELKDHFLPEMIDRACNRVDLPNEIVTRGEFERALADIFSGKSIDIRNYLPQRLT